MRIEPLNFRSFDSSAAGGVVVARRHAAVKKEEAPPAAPPPPAITEEDLKAAELKGYQRGFLEGSEDGKRQAENEQAAIHRQLLDHSHLLLRSLQPLLENYKAMALQMHSDLPKVALAIARKVAGPALESGAEQLVTEMARACMQTMIGEPRLCVHVHPSLSTTLESTLASMASQYQDSSCIVVVADAAMALSDCRISWKHGAMERHTGQLWQEIERITENMVASAARITQQQLQPLEQASSKE